MDMAYARDVARKAAAESLRQIVDDHRVAGRLRGNEPALSVAVRETLQEALAHPSRADGHALRDFCQRRGWTLDEFDVLGHHLLTAVLAQRVGVEALVRVGAALTRVRQRLAGPAPGAGRPRPDRRGRNSASRHYAPPAHLPLPPSWRCSGCAAAWPCPTKQSQLLVEFGGTTAGLAVYLGACLVAATKDLPALPPAQARARFLGWLPRRRF
ncbi:hypothetical protein ACGFI5_29825 [Micromonospora tulbaghiae]|nr:hypothetical protein [Micromonospora tulbaghiae]MDX5458260.1 hypothetical protein [Micromonospora tulbaghiae]